MADREFFEDYREGEKFVSGSRSITESDIVNFAMMVGDWHPIHVDKEYASKTEFGQRIAHGMLALSLGGSMCMWLGPNTFAPRNFIAFLGMDDVKFKKPTFIGDTIHWEGTVASLKRVSRGRGVITYLCDIVKQDASVVVEYKHHILVKTRDELEEKK